MANVGDTGNGATFVLATTAFSAAITKITINEVTIDNVNVSTLATTVYELLIKGDLSEPPMITIDFVFATTVTQPVVGSAPETGTLTFPTRSGESTAANIAGTGYVSGHKFPDFANNEVQAGQFKFQYDGDTGPAFTAAT